MFPLCSWNPQIFLCIYIFLWFSSPCDRLLLKWFEAKSDIPWWNLIIRASEVTWLLTWRLPRSLKHLSILLSWPQAVQIFDLEESFCHPHLLMIVFTICQRHPSSYWHYEWLLRICYQHSNVVKDALTKGDSQYSNYVSRVPIVWMQP